MPTLVRAAEYAARGCLIKPLVTGCFQDPAWKFEFDLRVARPLPRQPDGWFHASQHPMATPAELYQWLSAAHGQPEERDYVSAMSVTFGTMSHGLITALLGRLGLTVPLPEGDCPVCGLPYRPRRSRGGPQYCGEHGGIDAESQSRCHLDAILSFGEQGMYLFEFKTIKPYGLKDVPDMDEGYFQEHWPKYWAQVQECMRLTGLRNAIVFFMGLGNPWEMREFHVRYDALWAEGVAAKYREVLAARAAGVRPLL